MSRINRPIARNIVLGYQFKNVVCNVLHNCFNTIQILVIYPLEEKRKQENIDYTTYVTQNTSFND